MKIYYASQSFYPHIGGVSTYLLNLAREIVKKGNDVVEIHLRPSGEEGDDEIHGIEIRRVPRQPLDKNILKGYSKFKEAVYTESHYHKKEFTKPVDEMIGFSDFNKVNEYFGEEIKDLLEQEPADIVHIHDFQLLFSYRYVPRGTALVFTWHIPFIKEMSPTLSEFLVRNLKEYDKVVFSSQEYIDAAVKAGFPKEKAALIHPICNTQLFREMDIDSGEVRRHYKIPIHSKVILCVQRVDPKSGHEQLIKAMPHVLKKVPDAKLVFVGGKSMSNKLSKDREILHDNILKLIDDLGITKNVIWTGNIDYHKIPEIYNAADLVALCSRNEGFGLSVTEGMACGNPVVGTKVGGIPLQVKDGKNGFLVEVGDHKDTANKIVKILSDDKLRKTMRNNSLRIVDENFKMYIGIEKHLMLYNQVKKQKDEFHKVEYLDRQNIKAIITDLDRTIIDEPAKREFDPADFDKELLKELKRLNIDLILATGRTIKFVKKLCKKFKIWRCVVAENGAVLYFPPTDKTISINTSYMKKVKKIIKDLDLPETTTGKIITSNRYSDKELIEEKIGDLRENVELIQNVDELMMLPKGVDKGLGIRLAMLYMNIDIDKTIVIGDGENDVDMFLNPGFKVALENANEKLKNLANQITKYPATKGVREVIEKISKK